MVNNLEDVKEAFETATNEAINSFGDGRVFIEKFIENPRHIEVQILADMILNFNWQGAKVYQGQQKTDAYNIEAFTEVKKYELDKFALIGDVTARLDTVVSEFKDANGNVGYMFVNYSEPSLQLSGNVIVNFSSVINKAVLYVDGEKKVVDVKDSKLVLDLSAGGSVFLYPYYEGGAK